MRRAEDLLALVEKRDRIMKQLKQIEAEEAQQVNNPECTEVMNLLFKTEHSKMYLEDFAKSSHQMLDSAEMSGYDDEMIASDEYELYNQIHLEEDKITSGYSTISSSKEEAYLSRHIANQSAIAATKAARTNQSTLIGMMTG